MFEIVAVNSVPIKAITVRAISKLLVVCPLASLKIVLSKPKQRQMKADTRVNVPAPECKSLVKTVLSVYKLMTPPTRLTQVRIIAIRPEIKT